MIALIAENGQVAYLVTMFLAALFGHIAGRALLRKGL